MDTYPTETMTSSQIAGLALAMYSQGGELFEQLSKFFMMLDQGEEERVIFFYTNALRGIYREQGIVTWLEKNRYQYNSRLIHVFKYLDENNTPNAFHVIQVARFVLTENDLESFCTIANMISNETKRDLITKNLRLRPR